MIPTPEASKPVDAAEAPAQAIAALYQVASHAAGLALQNAVHAQQAFNQLSSAVVSKAVQLIMAIGEKP